MSDYQAMSKRYIRLKEFHPRSERIYTPADDYLAARKDLPPNRSYAMKVDADGFIETGNCIYSNNKVFILGDSLGENLFVDQSNRFGSVLERSLLEAGYDIQVLNASLSGAQSINLLNTIISKVVPYQPKLIVFIIPSNDLPTLKLDGKYWNTDKYFATIIESEELPYQGYFDISKMDNHIVFERTLLSIINVTKAFGLETLFLTTPHAESYNNYFTSHFYNKEHYVNLFEERERLNSIAKQVFSSEKCNFIESNLFLRDINTFYDAVHLSQQGSILLGEMLFLKVSEMLPLQYSLPVRCEKIIDSVTLSDDIVWSKPVTFSRQSLAVTLILDMENLGVSEINIALFCVKYTNKRVLSESETQLKFSSYKDIGWYKYLSIKKNSSIELSIPIKIPIATSSISIGLMKWGTENDILLNSASIIYK